MPWTFTNDNFLLLLAVSATYVPGPIPESTRARHAPLYGRLVSEEHLPATHRDVHQVSSTCLTSIGSRSNKNFILFMDAAINQPLIIIDWHPGDAGANPNTLPWSVAGATAEVERWFNQNLQAHKWGNDSRHSHRRRQVHEADCGCGFSLRMSDVKEKGRWLPRKTDSSHIYHFQFTSFSIPRRVISDGRR